MANAADTNPRLSLHFSDSLMKNFIAGTKFPPKLVDTVTSEEDEGVELSLGLSLNGRFGFDPTRDKNLSRSSSIPEFLKKDEEGTSVSVTWTPILRTSSLPMEECRKRKQMQSLRRMEAKRKRTEKQRNVMNKKVAIEEDHHSSKIMGNNKPTTENDNLLLPASQGSASSGISEFDTQSIQGNEYTEEGSPPQLGKPKPRQEALNGVATDKSMSKVLLEMPCVSTTGEGPNGRRIEGFLYRYRKGEEVRIVCVCHGSFLSPAEFVKHAGGADVLHPLKHIVVTPSPVA